MKKTNIWQSTLSGMIYEMPLDWIPAFPGWKLLGTRRRKENNN